MWIGATPQGPSAKFIVRNITTIDELKMTGNCLKGSRPIISFDDNFDKEQYNILKEMFTFCFSVPRNSRKVKPFIDHVMSFSIIDSKVRFFNYRFGLGIIRLSLKKN
jgi:ribosome biogenesis protein BRX1